MIDIDTPEAELLQQFFDYEERLQDALVSSSRPKIVWDSSFTPAFILNASIPVETGDSEESDAWDYFHYLSLGQVQVAKEIQFVLGEMNKIIPYLRYYLIKIETSIKKLPDSDIEILSFNLARPIKRPKRKAHLALLKSINEELGVMAWLKSQPAVETVDPDTGTSIIGYNDIVGPLDPSSGPFPPE